MRRVETELVCYSGAEALLTAIRSEGYIPDIAVLDINMDGMDGISLARQLNEIVPECKIIFLSSYLSYAQDVYAVDHVWFILKHDAELRMESALSKAVSIIKQKRGEITVLVKSGDGSKLIKLCDIISLERNGLRTTVHCADEDIITAKSPASLLDSVPEAAFVRCHQSKWVNLTHIKSLDKDEFILSDREHIPLSRTYKAEAKKAYFDFM